MGQAKRKRDANQAQKQDIKLSPRQQATPVVFVLAQRIEQQQGGATYATSFYGAVDAKTGKPLCEETPDGPVQLLVQTVAIRIKKSGLVLARG